MFSEKEKAHCKDTKNVFENHYRIFTVSLATIADRTVFAGGVFASIFLDEKPRDVDVFILSSNEDDRRVFKTFCEMNNYPINKKIDAEQTYKNVNSHISSVWKMTRNKKEYDIIFTNYASVEELMFDFDYEHSKVWYHNGNLSLTEKTYRAIMDMKLIPISGKRIDEVRKTKFLNRGWKE